MTRCMQRGRTLQNARKVREHFSVQELLMDGDRVTGIRGHAAGGATVTEEARIVIGADGLRSLVARNVQAPAYNVTHSHRMALCAVGRVDLGVDVEWIRAAPMAAGVAAGIVSVDGPIWPGIDERGKCSRKMQTGEIRDPARVSFRFEASSALSARALGRHRYCSSRSSISSPWS